MQRCLFSLGCAFYLVAAEPGHRPSQQGYGVLDASHCFHSRRHCSPPWTAWVTPTGAIILGFHLAGAQLPSHLPVSTAAFFSRSHPVCHRTERLSLPAGAKYALWSLFPPCTGFLFWCSLLLQACSVVPAGMHACHLVLGASAVPSTEPGHALEGVVPGRA